MFKYKPEWQGHLSGPSFEKQTEDFLNGIESRVDEIDTRQTPSNAIPMAPGVGSAGTSDEYSRGDHSHPLQSSVPGSAGSADVLSTPRKISMSGEGSGDAWFDGSSNISIPLAVACIADGTTERRGIADRFADTVSVKDFGAVGDGVTDDTAAVAAAIAGADERKVHGSHGTYKVTSLPDFLLLRDMVLLKDGMYYPTSDYFDMDVAKISDSGKYLAWPEDKAYVLGPNTIRVWCHRANAHVQSVSNPRDICCLTSTDGGVSFSAPTFLSKDLGGYACWSAGTDGTYEYLIVEDGDGNNSPWYLYKRPAPTGASTDVYDDTNPWTVTSITFPIPAWETTDTTPVMIHSFCAMPSGRIVVGASFTHGCGLYYSDDQGSSWTFVTLKEGTQYEEPTVKCTSDGVLCGFIRSGNDGTGVQWWYSADNLATVSTANAPSGFFGPNGLQDACIELGIDGTTVYAFTAQRDGTLAGSSDDRIAPIYMIIGSVTQYFWSGAKIYNLGFLDHYETGGASACGQGSVVIHNGRVFYFFGNEESTGNVANTTATYSKVTNIWSISMPLLETQGIIGNAFHLPLLRATTGGFYRDFSSRTFAPVGTFVVRSSETPGCKINSVAAKMLIDCGAGASNLNMVMASSSSSANYGYIATDYRTDGNVSYSGMRILALTASDVVHSDIVFYAAGEAKLRYKHSSDMFYPVTSKATNLGGPSNLWNNLYCQDGPWSGSDARIKANVEDVSDALMRAWGKVSFKVFQKKDALAKKGATARVHVGVIAQQVAEAFASEGLDAGRYGFFGYDEWEDEYEDVEVEKHGETVVEQRLVRKAGNAYSIRYEEALALECAYQRWLGEKQSRRIADLEKRLAEIVR